MDGIVSGMYTTMVLSNNMVVWDTGEVYVSPQYIYEF